MEAIRKAKRIWKSRRIGCFVSVGTGLMESVNAENRTREQMGMVVDAAAKFFAPRKAEQISIAEACVNIALDCHDIHNHVFEHEAVEKHGKKNRYYRFNVDTGLSRIELDEYNKLRGISEYTKSYLSDPQQKQWLADCVSLLSSEKEISANIGQ